MKSAGMPPDEAARLAALEQTHLMFSPAEERFDRVARLAAHVFDTPMALITLVDGTRQWFKASYGVDLRETPREVAFCAHAIADGDRLVVEDASTDERFADNPLVTGAPNIRAYAGEVIRSPSGHALGTLCVLDSKPRRFSPEALELLQDLSKIAESEVRRSETGGAQVKFLHEMETEVRAHALDEVTRCWNHDAMVELLMRQADLAQASGTAFAIGLIGLERFRQVSTKLGAEARDQVLGEMASAIRSALFEDDALGRYDAEHFVVLLPGVDERAARAGAARISKAVVSRTFKAGRIGVTLGVTTGLAIWSRGTSLVNLVEAADRALKLARERKEIWAVAQAV